MKKVAKVLFIVFVVVPCGCYLAFNLLLGGSFRPSEPTKLQPLSNVMTFEEIPADIHLLAHQRSKKVVDPVIVFEGDEMYCVAAGSRNTCPTTNHVLAVMACDDTLTEYDVEYMDGRYLVSSGNYTLCMLDENFTTIEY